jgi:xanthine dehydrogenase accessory factor
MILDTVIELHQKQIPFVEIILVDARGSTPADQGCRAIIGLNGLIAGTVGGGKVEARAINFALEMLNDESALKSSFVTWNLQKDIGMTCGGEVKLFFQVYNTNNWNIAVFGAGHVAISLISLLTTLDCKITCIDPRIEWLDKIVNNSKITKICTEDPYKIVRQLHKDTFFVLMSKGHAFDLPVLKEILETRTAKYLGVIGSDSKKNVLLKELKELGINANADTFRCPIGLDLGNSSPAEIAVSISAELITIRDKILKNQ